MSAHIIAFFNNKGGVGKTSLVYHLSWMYADKGLKVLAADLDPQANLSAAFLEEERLEEFWPDGDHSKTVYGSILQVPRGIEDTSADHHSEVIVSMIHTLVGDLSLTRCDDEHSTQ